MSLTKKQKEQIILMIEQPDVFLYEVINNKINLHSFNDKFFQNGDGIFHILVNQLNSDFDKYKDIIYEITKEKYQLNIFQSKLNKENAFDLLISQIPISHNFNTANIDNVKLVKKYVNLIDSIIPYGINLEEIYNYIGYLINNNEFYIDSSLIIKDNKYSISHVLDKINYFNNINDESKLFFILEEVIRNKNKKALKDLINNNYIFNLFDEKIATLKFNTAQPYYTKVMSNIDVLLSKHYNKEIIEIILNKFSKIDLNYKDINHKEHLLLKILSQKDFAFADSIYSQISLLSKINFLTFQNRIINIISKEKEFYSKVSKDIPLILSSIEIKDEIKIELIKQLLVVDDNSENRKYRNLEEMLEGIIIPKDDNYLSIFFLGLKQKLDNLDEINSFVNIFSKLLNLDELDKIHSINMYNKNLFENPILLEKLLEQNFPLSSNKTNIYTSIKEIYINNYSRFESIVNNNNFKKSLMLIKNKDKDRFLSDNSIIESLIKDSNILIYDILDESDFNNISKFHKELAFSYVRGTNQYPEHIEKILLKLSAYDFNFNIDIPFVGLSQFISLNLIKNGNIEQFLINTQQNINESIKSYQFWSRFTSKDLFEYIENKKIPIELNSENKKSLLKSLLEYSFHKEQTFKLLMLYPEFLNIALDNNDNILHQSIRNKNYDVAIYIIQNSPEQALQLNKKNELPLTLLIKDVYSNIKSHYKDTSSQLNNEKSYSLFKLMLNKSFIKNNKVMDFINEKIEKYPLIKEKFPKEIEDFNYYYLKNSMVEKKYTKQNKI